MVFIKSVEDPLWSPEDLASSKGALPWILLVLNPSERFYELDPLLDNLSQKSSQLVIWRPDRPSPQEAALLRVTALDDAIHRTETDNRDTAPVNGAHKILGALYVTRGMLIVQGIRYSVSKGMADTDIQQFISTCFLSLAPAAHTQLEPSAQNSDMSDLNWAGLLCGQDGATLELAAAKDLLLDWAAAHLDLEHGILTGRKTPLPEPFLTTGFLNEAKWFDSALERVRHLLQSVRRGEVRLNQAMQQIAHAFQYDEARLLRWKGLVEDFHGFFQWLYVFDRSFDYVSSAFPTRNPELEDLRTSLLEAASQPVGFLGARERDRFCRMFDEFREKYIDYYHVAHEDTVHIMGDQQRLRRKVDSVALRNLELLSGLPYADKGHLERARVIGSFIKASQCSFPVRDILARQPRCYCGFNPELAGHFRRSVERMNETIRTGIAQFRTTLRRCRITVIEGLKDGGADVRCAKQIAALLGRGPMLALKQQTIDVLAEIMRTHPDEFRAAANRNAVPNQIPLDAEFGRLTSEMNGDSPNPAFQAADLIAETTE